ncbi:MAG: hypothetical protein AAFY98_08765 [Verrucomicrobiota bacterium]
MSIAEILEVLPRLKAEDRHLLRDRLDELDYGEFEETQEILAAIDAGIRSAETEPGFTVNEVREKISSWATKSS